jgi:hypothetical protein
MPSSEPLASKRPSRDQATALTARAFELLRSNSTLLGLVGVRIFHNRTD